MSLPEYIDDINITEVMQQIDRIVAQPSAIDEAALDLLIGALIRGRNFRPFIAGRISKLGDMTNSRIRRLLLSSDDPDLLVNCSLLLLSNSDTIGITCLLRAVASGHPLQIVIAQRLARKRFAALSDAVRIAHGNGLYEKFELFITIISALNNVDSSLSKQMLEDYIDMNNPDLRFHTDIVGEIRNSP